MLQKNNNNYEKQNFFIPDMFDNLGASFKDDMVSMEHPIFVLSKKKDMRCLEYKRGDTKISITPSVLGLPTIFDKDILLYCAGLLMTEINAGRIPPRTLRISTHDLLNTTNRLTNGLAYERLQNALKRLRGVTITTNIKTNRREVTKGFGLIESYEIFESHKIKNRMIRLEITLSEWFYNSIIGKEVLTIHRDYFKLGKPIERRLYEIARKHCGSSPQWEIRLDKLMEKTGSTDTLRKFKLRIKEIAQENTLPDYSFEIDKNDKVTFFQKSSSKKEALVSHRLEHILLETVSTQTIKKAKEMAEKARLDFEELLSQWYLFVEKNGSPENPNGALMGFIKHKTNSI
jgi:plasmid replication initiation protein